jgi:hypothetical protein
MNDRRGRFALFAAAIALVLLIAACGDDDDSAAEVRPFEEVQATEFVFELDANNPSRGIFRVDTTEPMICAIVWGETERLGRFNNSLNMNGTGIIEHNVFLPDATGGETYYFRVQGSTVDGTLYQTELATFTLPDPPAASGQPADEGDVGPDLRDGASVVDISSEFSDFWGGANVLDGDMSTEWSTAGDGDDAYITIDLGEMREIGAFELVTRSMADGSATILAYTVVLEDGTRLGPFEAGTPAQPALQRELLEGRTLRFEVAASTGGNTGAIEIKLFGPPE